MKDVELPLNYFGEGANIFDLFAKPNPKTVQRFLKDIPAHIEAFREVLAFNMILRSDEGAHAVGITATLEDRKKLPGVQLDANAAIDRVQPRKFLKAVNALQGSKLNENVKAATDKFYDVDFSGIVQRIEVFETALALPSQGSAAERKKALNDGVDALNELKDFYNGVLARLYGLGGDSFDTDVFKPFDNIVGALANKIDLAVKAAYPERVVKTGK